MALPKLNATPKYELTIPSSGKRVRFRPYLVKEEKVLLMAMESQDNKAAMEALVDTIEACVEDKFNKNKLTTFDIEFMFTQIRSKSSGESSTISIKCQECGEGNEHVIELDKLKVDVPKVKNSYALTADVSVSLEYPSYKKLMTFDLDGEQQTETMFSLVCACIKSINFEGEQTLAEDCSEEELNEFIESMTRGQFAILTEFIQNMPKLQHEAKFTCGSCSAKNEIMIEGLQNFF